MSWFEKLMPSRISTEQRTRSVPEGVWIKCPECDAQLYRTELERNLNVCPKCDYHIRIGARTRLKFFLDPDMQEEIAGNLEPQDPLRFRDSKKYRDRITQAQKKTGEKDALVAMKGRLFGRPIVACAFEFGFMGGSMGSVVGERFCRAANYCAENRVPLIAFSASGGARMQEALFSLLQMAKTSAALAVLGETENSVHICADGPDDRRRLRQPGNARRCEYCRAQSADRICRTAGDRTNGFARNCRKGFSAASFCWITVRST